MFCRKCGTENEDQAVFCKECGARLVLGSSLESQIKKLVKRIASLPKKYKVGAGIGIAAVVVILIVVVNELLSLGQRFEVANMLRNHKTYNEVAEVTGASTATISRVNRCLNYGTDGYQLVLSRMEKLEKKED